MWGTQNLPTFALGALVFVLLPGPSSLTTLGCAAQSGVRAGLRCALGVVCGEVTLMVLTVVGAAGLLRADPQIVVWVRWLGAVYIAWLGIGMLRAAFGALRAARERNAEPAPAPHGAVATAGTRRAYVITVLNPKAILFFLSFFLQFVDPAAQRPHLAFATLGAVYELLSACYLSCLVLAAARIGRAVDGRLRLTAVLRGSAGVVFLGFSTALALGL
ncbi:leucine efflux protein LeuE [Streptomyces sp. NBC_01264]|uniref:leucine efflux protein LeuE n=1 Tax=Streptomyces sp. NBC_01264 TaxID=2903804 RepID=UPI0022549C24|nr:leucine efflux protein LeuE [Streptomyces sp. NBC_01264]MCX4781746.1 leucine efflux protein LeuE [Streptomyces sp. NBC_01264]